MCVCRRTSPDCSASTTTHAGLLLSRPRRRRRKSSGQLRSSSLTAKNTTQLLHKAVWPGIVNKGYGYEAYLTNIKNSRLRVLLSNFRLGNHKLQNQQARWMRDPAAADTVPVCKACRAHNKDEEHLLIHCSTYNKVRQNLPQHHCMTS